MERNLKNVVAGLTQLKGYMARINRGCYVRGNNVIVNAIEI